MMTGGISGSRVNAFPPPCVCRLHVPQYSGRDPQLDQTPSVPASASTLQHTRGSTEMTLSQKVTGTVRVTVMRRLSHTWQAQ